MLDPAHHNRKFGSLPEGWKVCRLADVLSEQIKNGLFARRERFGSGSPFLNVADIYKNSRADLRLAERVHATEKELSQFGLSKGDLVFVRSSLKREGIGQCCEVGDVPEPSTFDCHLMRVRVDRKRLLPDFLAFYANTRSGKHDIIALSKTTTMTTLNQDGLSAFCIPLPPLPEQKDIAHVLRTVQRVKEASEKVIAAAQQLKSGLMRHLFTYGPVPFHETDKVELKETDFGNVPARWPTEPLGDCTAVQTGVAKGRRLDGDDAVSVPYLRVANVQLGYLDLTEIKHITIRKRELDRYSLRDGDVVLTEGGDFDKLGRGVIWRGEVPTCVHQNHIFAVRADRNRLISDFVAHQTQSGYGRAYFLSVAHRTTNLACINTTKLKQFPMLIPPKDEQRRINEILDAVDRKLQHEAQKAAALNTLFQSLLHHLMTGTIRVHEFERAVPEVV